MLKKVTIKNIKIADKKYGTEDKYVYKSGKNVGKNFVMVSIQTNETGDNYYSTPALPTDQAAQLNEGDTVILKLTETTSSDGQKVFKNFNIPSKAEKEAYQQALEDVANIQ